MIARDVKVKVGQSGQLFIWCAHRPVTGTPALSIDHPSLGTLTPTLTRVVAAEPTVAAVDTDRRTLTLSASVSGAGGAQGYRWGAAFVVTSSDGWFPVRVVRATGTTVKLAQPIPREIDVTSATIQWATWTASADLFMASAQRDIVWTVAHVTSEGAGVPTEARTDLGTLHVVPQPFGTGLDSATLEALFPRIVQPVHRGADSLAPQIDAAEALIISNIRARLQKTEGGGKWEDDIPASQRLQMAHAHITCAIILDERDREGAAAHRELADDYLDEAMRRVWVDQDGDLDPEDGGTDSQQGGVPPQVSSSFTTTPTYTFPATTRWW